MRFSIDFADDFLIIGVVVFILSVIHFLKMRELRSLKRQVKQLYDEVQVCKNSFGNYLSLLDEENVRLKNKLAKK